jgi:hypothetical protein
MKPYLHVIYLKFYAISSDSDTITGRLPYAEKKPPIAGRLKLFVVVSA